MKTIQLRQRLSAAFHASVVFLLTFDPRDLLLDFDGQYMLQERGRRQGEHRLRRCRAHIVDLKLAIRAAKRAVAAKYEQVQQGRQLLQFRLGRLLMVPRLLLQAAVLECRAAVYANLPGADLPSMQTPLPALPLLPAPAGICQEVMQPVKKTNPKRRKRAGAANALMTQDVMKTVDISNGHVPSTKELNELNVDQLRSLASLLNLTGFFKFKKAGLILAIRNEARKHKEAEEA